MQLTEELNIELLEINSHNRIIIIKTGVCRFFIQEKAIKNKDYDVLYKKNIFLCLLFGQLIKLF